MRRERAAHETRELHGARRCPGEVVLQALEHGTPLPDPVVLAQDHEEIPRDQQHERRSDRARPEPGAPRERRGARRRDAADEGDQVQEVAHDEHAVARREAREEQQQRRRPERELRRVSRAHESDRARDRAAREERAAPLRGRRHREREIAKQLREIGPSRLDRVGRDSEGRLVQARVMRAHPPDPREHLPGLEQRARRDQREGDRSHGGRKQRARDRRPQRETRTRGAHCVEERESEQHGQQQPGAVLRARRGAERRCGAEQMAPPRAAAGIAGPARERSADELRHQRVGREVARVVVELPRRRVEERRERCRRRPERLQAPEQPEAPEQREREARGARGQQHAAPLARQVWRLCARLGPAALPHRPRGPAARERHRPGGREGQVEDERGMVVVTARQQASALHRRNGAPQLRALVPVLAEVETEGAAEGEDRDDRNGGRVRALPQSPTHRVHPARCRSGAEIGRAVLADRAAGRSPLLREELEDVGERVHRVECSAA